MKHISLGFAAKIVLDCADLKHDFCLNYSGLDAFEFSTFEHNSEKIDDLALALQKRVNNKPIAICLELNPGPIVHASR